MEIRGMTMRKTSVGAFACLVAVSAMGCMPKMTMEEYRREYSAMVAHMRQYDLTVPCVIMTPLDHGERKGVRIVTRKVVPLIVEAQRKSDVPARIFAFFGMRSFEPGLRRWVRSCLRTNTASAMRVSLT